MAVSASLPSLATPAAYAVVVFNVLDAIFTLVYVQAGAAEEGNPLMAVLLAWHPVSFVALKLALVSLGVWLLWRVRHHRAAVAAIVGIAVVYAGVLALHLSAAHRLI
jgi:hypothetical protein